MTVYVNLPVRDVAAARAFWTETGFAVEERFSGETSVAVVLEEGAAMAMLLAHDFFSTFLAGTEIADTARTTQVITCLSAETRDEVDDLVARAVAAGGKPHRPSFAMGDTMYGGSFTDPDGHVWEVVWTAPEAR